MEARDNQTERFWYKPVERQNRSSRRYEKLPEKHSHTSQGSKSNSPSIFYQIISLRSKSLTAMQVATTIPAMIHAILTEARAA